MIQNHTTIPIGPTLEILDSYYDLFSLDPISTPFVTPIQFGTIVSVLLLLHNRFRIIQYGYGKDECGDGSRSLHVILNILQHLNYRKMFYHTLCFIGFIIVLVPILLPIYMACLLYRYYIQSGIIVSVYYT